MVHSVQYSQPFLGYTSAAVLVLFILLTAIFSKKVKDLQQFFPLGIEEKGRIDRIESWNKRLHIFIMLYLLSVFAAHFLF